MMAWATRHMMLPMINDEAMTKMLLRTTDDVSKRWRRRRGRKVRQLAKEPEGCFVGVLMSGEGGTAGLDACIGS